MLPVQPEPSEIYACLESALMTPPTDAEVKKIMQEMDSTLLGMSQESSESDEETGESVSGLSPIIMTLSSTLVDDEGT